MRAHIQIVAVTASLILLLVVLELVRRRRLFERYAILWLLSSVVLLGLAVWSGLLALVSRAVGIKYPPSALFLFALGFVLLLLLHFSVAVSRLSDQSKVLAQRLALLEERLRELRERERGDEAGPRAVTLAAERSAAASERSAERSQAVVGPRGAVGARRPPSAG
ncbi:MAG: DUF2304 family protein [Solirubrobacteraceae bacterium]|jgi:hypothetical protein